MIKDIDKYKLINSEYEVHEDNCKTMNDLREKNKKCLDILKSMLYMLEDKYLKSEDGYKNYIFSVYETYIFSYIQDEDWTKYVFRQDVIGYKIKIVDDRMIHIIRDIWYNENSEYEEKENLFFYNYLFERVFLYDYDDYLEILVG